MIGEKQASNEKAKKLHESWRTCLIARAEMVSKKRPCYKTQPVGGLPTKKMRNSNGEPVRAAMSAEHSEEEDEPEDLGGDGDTDLFSIIQKFVKLDQGTNTSIR